MSALSSPLVPRYLPSLSSVDGGLLNGAEMDTQTDQQPAPEWFIKLEGRKVKHTLAHEADNGAPCLKCGEKCPGLDLHFWRKLCRNCKCKKEDHDVQPDENHFELVFGRKPIKPVKKLPTVLPLKLEYPGKVEKEIQVAMDWVPPGIPEDMAAEYMGMLPKEKLPISDTPGAQYRRLQIERQIPPHDFMPDLCHDLTAEEKKKQEQYLENLRDKAVGQGHVVRTPLGQSIVVSTDQRGFGPLQINKSVLITSGCQTDENQNPNWSEILTRSNLPNGRYDVIRDPTMEAKITELQKKDPQFAELLRKRNDVCGKYGIVGYPLSDAEVTVVEKKDPQFAKVLRRRNGPDFEVFGFPLTEAELLELEKKDPQLAQRLRRRNPNLAYPKLKSFGYSVPERLIIELEKRDPEFAHLLRERNDKQYGILSYPMSETEILRLEKKDPEFANLLRSRKNGKYEVLRYPLTEAEITLVSRTDPTFAKLLRRRNNNKHEVLSHPLSEAELYNLKKKNPQFAEILSRTPNLASRKYGVLGYPLSEAELLQLEKNTPQFAELLRARNRGRYGALGYPLTESEILELEKDNPEFAGLLRSRNIGKFGVLGYPLSYAEISELKKTDPQFSELLRKSNLANGTLEVLGYPLLEPELTNVEKKEPQFAQMLRKRKDPEFGTLGYPLSETELLELDERDPDLGDILRKRNQANYAAFGYPLSEAEMEEIERKDPEFAQFLRKRNNGVSDFPFSEAELVELERKDPQFAQMVRSYRPKFAELRQRDETGSGGQGLEPLSPAVQSMSLGKELRCHGCDKTVQTGSLAVMIENGGRSYYFHPACFVCSMCYELLVDLVYTFHKGRVYCCRDYATIKKIPRCHACDELIFVSEYIFADDRTFHVKHFCCLECDKPVINAEYTPVDNNPVCMNCFNSKYYNKPCQKCSRTITPTEKRVRLKEFSWHDYCFTCTTCGKSLMNKGIILRQGVPYCSKECSSKQS